MDQRLRSTSPRQGKTPADRLKEKHKSIPLGVDGELLRMYLLASTKEKSPWLLRNNGNRAVFVWLWMRDERSHSKEYVEKIDRDHQNKILK